MKSNFLSPVLSCILLLAFSCLVVSCGDDVTTTPPTNDITTTTAPVATSSNPTTSQKPTAPTTEPPATSSTEPSASTTSDVPNPVFPPLGMGDTDKWPRFLWSEVAGAASYEFQLSIEKDFVAPIIVSKVTTYQYYYKDEALQYSLQYYWRVRAIDVNGTPGNWCETQYFTVCPDC
ncbi:MAG: hypothetical protein JW954_01835 [Dehalococcoidaceae bacterium]|nr:hypothetical protein [Dehalococcoidaceae bacterium]